VGAEEVGVILLCRRLRDPLLVLAQAKGVLERVEKERERNKEEKEKKKREGKKGKSAT